MAASFQKWRKDLPKNHRQSVDFIIGELLPFEGEIALVGSSTGEKYPIGRDIDLALLGLGTLEGKKYVRQLYKNLMRVTLATWRSSIMERSHRALIIPS